MHQEVPDHQLVQRLAEGDTGALAELVRRYQQRVVAFLCQKLGGDLETARDLAQETFLRVWKAADRFDPSYRFSTWLFRIAANLAVDTLRRQRTVPLEEGVNAKLPGDQKPLSDPYRRALSSEVARKLALAVNGLKKDLREVVLLRHFAGLSYQEIADFLNIPLGTVKNKLFRAHRVLRNALAGYGVRDEG